MVEGMEGIDEKLPWESSRQEGLCAAVRASTPIFNVRPAFSLFVTLDKLPHFSEPQF